VDRSFLRREWGAVTFVLTVFAGIVIVPAALVLGNQSPRPAALVASPTPTVSAPATPSPAAATAPRTSSPTPTS
jgi:hypothetical protein